GSKLVFGRQIHPGELVAFVAYIGYLYDPAVRLVDFNVQAQLAGAAIDRVFETLDTRPEIVDAPDAISLRELKGAVEFRGVAFGYDRPHKSDDGRSTIDDRGKAVVHTPPNARRPTPDTIVPRPSSIVLNHIDLRVNPGEVIAI